MNATGKSHFTERILRIAGIIPQRSLRSNWLILLFLPLLFVLSSWWPAAQTPVEPPEHLPFNLVEPARNLSKKSVSLVLPEPNAEFQNIQTHTPATADSVAPGGYVVAAAPLKMNVFYIGVDNPLRVAASGIPAQELSPRLVGAGTLRGSNGDYVVTVSQPGEVTIQIFRKQGAKETLLGEEKYRVKRIPDPTPKLGGKYLSQTISLKTLKEMRGIEVVLENFLLDATCEIMGYELTIAPIKRDPIMMDVAGGQFPPQAVELFNTLDSLGGAIFMDNIRLKCPGDAAPRHVGGLAFKIKNNE